jgi:hypothetical protein
LEEPDDDVGDAAAVVALPGCASLALQPAIVRKPAATLQAIASRNCAFLLIGLLIVIVW